MTTITNRGLRGSTIVALAAIGVLGLAGCASGGGAEESSSSEAPASSASEAPESSASESPAAESSGELCSTEQIGTLLSGAGELPEAALAAATADFQPAAILGDLPVTCVFSVEEGGASASFAVLPGGEATLSAVGEQVTAAGGTVQEAQGVLSGTIDGLTVAGVPFASFTQATAGFEGVEDPVVVASTSAVG